MRTLDPLATIAILLLVITLGAASLSKRTESVAGWLAVIGLWWALREVHAFRGPWDFKLLFLLFASVVFTGVKVFQLLRWLIRRTPPEKGPPV